MCACVCLREVYGDVRMTYTTGVQGKCICVFLRMYVPHALVHPWVCLRTWCFRRSAPAVGDVRATGAVRRDDIKRGSRKRK